MKKENKKQSSFWSDPDYWDNTYKKDLEDGWGDQNQFRRSQYFEKFTKRYGLQAPLQILDAGCGISLLGELMAYMGHNVTAIDISPFAIQFCKERNNIKDILWKCIDWRLGLPYCPEYLRRKPFSEQKAYLDKELLALQKEGGNCTYEVKSWSDPILPADTYDLILNQNGLRRADKEETRLAAHSFYRLLKPGGLLIESTVNALEREKEIVPELINAGFSMKNEFLLPEEENQKQRLDPDKKYAVYCEMTG
jgi:2-polyprenyl-3-methyl-5-hydroxy-6-metoxy-1,4-benzoquinol methylase